MAAKVPASILVNCRVATTGIYTRKWQSIGSLFSKKEGLYPLKIRVYYQGKVVLYPLIYDLTKVDFEKLDAKRASDALSKIRENIVTVELHAKITANKIAPFDFEQFSNIFILENEYFRKKTKPVKTGPVKQNIIDDIPAEWSKKFRIFKEISPGPDFISRIFYSIIKSLLYQARIGTADNYQTSYNSLKSFKGSVRLSEITPPIPKRIRGLDD